MGLVPVLLGSYAANAVRTDDQEFDAVGAERKPALLTRRVTLRAEHRRTHFGVLISAYRLTELRVVLSTRALCGCTSSSETLIELLEAIRAASLWRRARASELFVFSSLRRLRHGASSSSPAFYSPGHPVFPSISR